MIWDTVGAQSFAWPTQWKCEPIQDTSGDWWQSFRVKTVPGVLYRLQESGNLEPGGWTVAETYYGTGGEWICPLFRVPAPAAVSQTPGASVPIVPRDPVRMAGLTFQRTTDNRTLVSWCSLDTRAPMRTILSGVTLDPIWDEFDAPYFMQHGSHFFAISPWMGAPVTYGAAAPETGPLDTAMLAQLAASLPEITENMANSVEAAASYVSRPQPAGAKGFFRIAADWAVNSDGDSRLDWQEAVLDGNNPFAADTDGDGAEDVARAAPPPGPAIDPATGLPRPVDAAGPTPEISIEVRHSVASYHRFIVPWDPAAGSDPTVSTNCGDAAELESSSSFAGFSAAFMAMAPGDDWRGLIPESMGNVKTTPSVPPAGFSGEGSHSVFYSASRPAYRLRLDSPAPAGGYSFPLRLAKVVEAIDPATAAPAGVTGVSEVALVLTVPEEEKVGAAVEPDPEMAGLNTLVTYYPFVADLWGHAKLANDHDILPIEKATGICVNPAGGLRAEILTNLSQLPAGTMVHWQTRPLRGDGTLEEWTYLLDPDNARVQGDTVSFSPPPPGIYQIRAEFAFPGGSTFHVPLLRMRHARSRTNSKDKSNPLLAAGQPDYFGVCPNDLAFAVREKAVKWLGSAAYRRAENWVVTDPDSQFNPNTTNSSKCNIFVTHVANQAGAETPYFSRWIVFPAAPLAKEDWFTEPEANVDLDAPGWGFRNVPDRPTPGMTVASPKAGGDARSGHVGILDYDGAWINAGAKTVNKSLHLIDGSQDYKPNNFRSR